VDRVGRTRGSWGLRASRLTHAAVAKVVLRDRRSRIEAEDVAPQGLPVLPDARLLPGERPERDEDSEGDAAERDTRPAPPVVGVMEAETAREHRAGQNHPPDCRQIGVAIRGEVEPVLDAPEHGKERRKIYHPDRQERRPAT